MSVGTSYDISCFSDIIGLSQIECECIDTNTGWDTSLSGLYVDKAEGLDLRMVEAVKDCVNENNLWLLMDAAKDKATRHFVADTNNRLLQKYIMARSNYYGNLGRLDYKNNRIVPRTYAGVRFATANIAGGYMHIKSITTCFSAAGNITLTIYNNLAEVVETVNLTTINGRSINTVDITLPLWDERFTNLEYYLLYTVDATNPCKDNQVHCNCGGFHYDFNLNKPYYKSVNNKLEGWAKWIMLGEFSTNTIDFYECESTAGSYMNGLSFNVDMYCDLGMQYCFEEPDIYDPLFMTVAFALLHQTAYQLIISILASPNVNRYTMCNGETLQALMGLHDKKYNECIQYLIDNANTENTNCLACRDNFKIGVGTL